MILSCCNGGGGYIIIPAMETLLWFSALMWLSFLIVLLLNHFLNSDLKDVTLLDDSRLPFVSIVVPARDEESDIEMAVTSYCSQDYPSYEVIVIDDESTDRTPEILERLKGKFPHLRVIKGGGPRSGWLGKPSALETGKIAAGGEWIVFADADIYYAPSLLRRALSYVLSRGGDFLSISPYIKTVGPFEAALMSNLMVVGACLFPSFLIERTKSPFFTFGAGVFNLIRRDALEATGAFTTLKRAIIDDIMLSRLTKGLGYKVCFAKGDDFASVRMYDGAIETIKGFSKNFFPVIRKVSFIVILPFALGIVVSIMPFVGFYDLFFHATLNVPALCALFLMHLVFFLMGTFFRQRWYFVFLNPIREIGWWVMLVWSAFVYYRHGGVKWRGRVFKD